MSNPTDFFDEGMAVALSTNPYDDDFVVRWNGRPIHLCAKEFEGNGTLIALDNLLESLKFWNYCVQKTYPEAGSFVKFLLDTHGIEEMEDFIRLGDLDDTGAVVKSNFRSVYGFSFKRAEDEWLEFLDNYTGN